MVGFKSLSVNHSPQSAYSELVFFSLSDRRTGKISSSVIRRLHAKLKKQQTTTMFIHLQLGGLQTTMYGLY